MLFSSWRALCAVLLPELHPQHLPSLFLLFLQIHIIDFDDENNIINKNVLLHQAGEIWHIGASPADKAVLTTCYNKSESHCFLLSLTSFTASSGIMLFYFLFFFTFCFSLFFSLFLFVSSAFYLRVITCALPLTRRSITGSLFSHVQQWWVLKSCSDPCLRLPCSQY